MKTECLTERIRGSVEAHHMMPATDSSPLVPVVLMVSGGSDSVALARLLPELYPQHLYVILHINHQLRGAEADADERFVLDLAEELGLPCEARRVDVAALAAAQTNGNIEDVGRQVRYRMAADLLDERCRQANCAPEQGRIATAHTRDDRVETLFMRLIVGGGASGLSSIPFVNGRVMRPLLDCTRAELREALHSGRAALWREDVSNEDTRHLRAFVRHEVIPLFVARNPELLATVARSLDVLADEDAYLRERAEELFRATCTLPAAAAEPAAAAVAAEAGSAEPAAAAAAAGSAEPAKPAETSRELHVSATLFDENPVMVRRVIREACRYVMPASARITFAHIDAIAANGRHIGFATDIPGDVTVRNVCGTLVIRQKSAAEKPRHVLRHAGRRSDTTV
jgi:tRNA(Ile)-lysidine synthetase-like protein